MKSSNHEMITSQNHKEIFKKNQIIWFLDINTKNNGAIFIFNPRTGQTFLKLNDRTSTRAAEQLAALIQSFPIKQRPSQIIVAPNNASSFQLLDFPNIAIRRSDLQLPLQASFLKMGKLGGIISKAAAQAQTVSFNMYDDWLENISPHTAFFRLILILRALDIDGEKARMLLIETKETIVTGAHHMWPCLSEDQWFKVEAALRDFVLYDYTEKNNVNMFGLTQSEIRHIILGDKF